MSFKFRKDDVVEVISGDYAKGNIQKKSNFDPEDAPKRHSRGRIVAIDRKKNTVVVEGVNYKVHHDKVRQTEGGEQEGGRNYREAPISISNIMLIDPSTDRPTRVGFEIRDGKKVRVTKGKNGGSVLENEKP